MRVEGCKQQQKTNKQSDLKQYNGSWLKVVVGVKVSICDLYSIIEFKTTKRYLHFVVVCYFLHIWL